MLCSLLIANPYMKPYMSHLRFVLLLSAAVFSCMYWSSYWQTCSILVPLNWFVPSLCCGSEGIRMFQWVPDLQTPTSSSTTPDPGPTYDHWHSTLTFFFDASPDNAKPPPWPSFPSRLFPLLGLAFLSKCGFMGSSSAVEGSVGTSGSCAPTGSGLRPSLSPRVLARSAMLLR